MSIASAVRRVARFEAKGESSHSTQTILRICASSKPTSNRRRDHRTPRRRAPADAVGARIMTIRFNRRVRLMRGLRAKLSKSGVSLSFGGQGLRFTIGPRGKRASVGLPVPASSGLQPSVDMSRTVRAMKPRSTSEPANAIAISSASVNVAVSVEASSMWAGRSSNFLMKAFLSNRDERGRVHPTSMETTNTARGPAAVSPATGCA